MTGVLFFLFGGAGWLLGVVGFFRAGRALAELRELRRAFAQLAATQPSPGEPVAPPAPATPDVAPDTAQPAQDAADNIAAEPADASAGDVEALLTTRWGVWLGAAALLLAGVFLVRYAVEQGFLGPAARCVLTALLGLGLLLAAEFLHRHEGPPIAGRFGRDQAPAGLGAGGVAMLFGAAYAAGPFYGLLSTLPGFMAMAACSFVGLAASLRYGQLTAAVGIVGGFATPALVATATPSLPGLFGYLLVVSAAALLVVRRTAWTWLGWATTIAGAAWICVAAIPDAPDRWAAAAFMPAAAALNLLLLPAAALDHPVGRRLAWVPFACLGAAGLWLEAMDPGDAPRLVLVLLSPIAVWKGAAESRLDRLPWLAALVGLLALLLWALPGAWAPQVARPLILAGAVFAGFHAAAGLWLERRAPNPLHWAGLVAAVPVLTLSVAYAQIVRFQTDMAWAAAALALTAGLTATAAAATREGAPRRAGLHAAGAVAALALGCAMLLHEYWLTLAVAMFLPPLALIEARADLPPLRPVALAVAALVLVRLVFNWYVLDYDFGATPLVNGLLAAYAAPLAAFALAAGLFRRRADDLLVAVLEAGAVAFAACFVALEIRSWFGDGRLTGPFSFGEIALDLLTLAVQATAYLYLAQHLAQHGGRPVLHWAARILGAAALVGGAVLLVANPAVTGAPAGGAALFAAYLAPALLAFLARHRLHGAEIRGSLGGYAVVAGFVWISLQIRQVFHPGALSLGRSPIAAAELWAWSGAWLGYGVALMVHGIGAKERFIRLAALTIIGLVCGKVFLVDMAGLTGLWRVLSFLGLGLALIGLGDAYRRFVLPARRIGS